MNFEYVDDGDFYELTLNEEESAKYEIGDDAREDLATKVREELVARSITSAVQVYHVNGDELWFIEATPSE
jgi:hypothetical protein